MKATESTLTALGSQQGRTAGVPTLRVVALYDGFITAVYAHEAVESLVGAVRAFMHVESSFWSFDMLARLDVRHPSIRVAARADVIIVAAAADSALPSHVKSWLMLSLRENGTGAPLMVVIHEDDFEESEAVSRLRADVSSVAEQWNTPLLSNNEFDACLENGFATELVDLKRRDGPGTDFNNLHAACSVGRWGINE